MSDTIQAIRGMSDVLPDQAPLWERFEDAVRDWLRDYGYRNMRMPIVEKTELFVRSIGEVTDIVEKEMYTFVDHLNGESLTLRPEGTASCVRAALQHNLLYAGPQRVYYTGPMFRHERPQKGRYRQFHQVGVEALGLPGPDVDAEHMAMCARLWRRLALDGIRLEINTLGSPESRARYRARLVKYLESRFDELDEDGRRRIHTNPLRVLDSKNPALQALIEGAPRLYDDLDEESLEHFESLQAILRALAIEYEIRPRLVRGLDYYNHTVFEWTTHRLGAQAAVCAGGRYDGLIAQLGGKPAPGCGFAMGVERLLALLAEAEGVQPPATPPDAYLAHSGPGTELHAWRMAESLRDAGLAVILHCGGGSFKSQLRKADASGARFAVIVGEAEAAAQKVSVKPLRELGEQVTVSLAGAVEMLQAGAARARATP
ncbi:MAG TPA: histidine--tRNA ligase [Burkholderiales bacterium]|nr:histidine--tRNA ligase [Burkholderiales bacterium]